MAKRKLNLNAAPDTAPLWAERERPVEPEPVVTPTSVAPRDERMMKVFDWLERAAAVGLRVQVSWGVEGALSPAAQRLRRASATPAPNSSLFKAAIVWQRAAEDQPDTLTAIEALMKLLPELPSSVQMVQPVDAFKKRNDALPE